ncbi:MAG: 1-acyl-sn-glycerol-3-phosphate acyltransferase [Pseudomonadota bacterium]
MRTFQSVLFVILFNLSTFVQMVFWTPVFFFLSREDGWKVVRLWGVNSLWLQHILIGTRFDFRGTENLPEDKGFLVSAKHQSTWETYAMLLFLRDPSYILKRELMFIPFFGWFASKMNVIPVNRGKRSEALKAMSRETAKQCAEGRQIVIYPEGTRRQAYAEPSYKYGITHMYSNLDVSVVPMALNSGLFWPRNGTKLYKGTTVLEFLPAIEPGLKPDDFSNTMIHAIESKTSELLEEAQNDPEYDGPIRPPQSA